MERPEAMTEVTSTGDTIVSPVTPLLGITPCENTQLQSRKYAGRHSQYIGHHSIPKICGHTIANIGWHNRELAKAFLTTCQRSQEDH